MKFKSLGPTAVPIPAPNIINLPGSFEEFCHDNITKYLSLWATSKYIPSLAGTAKPVQKALVRVPDSPALLMNRLPQSFYIQWW